MLVRTHQKESHNFTRIRQIRIYPIQRSQGHLIDIVGIICENKLATPIKILFYQQQSTKLETSLN